MVECEWGSYFRIQIRGRVLLQYLKDVGLKFEFKIQNQWNSAKEKKTEHERKWKRGRRGGEEKERRERKKEVGEILKSHLEEKIVGMERVRKTLKPWHVKALIEGGEFCHH